MKNSSIVVLGIGNVLLQDEGIGVQVVTYLKNAFCFSENVTLVDGGTLGSKLLHGMEKKDYLIVIDAYISGKRPGAISRIDYSSCDGQLIGKCSAHQTTFPEILSCARLLEIRPENIVLFGIEPKEIGLWETNLSAEVMDQFPALADLVLAEIKKAGGSAVRNHHYSYHPDHAVLSTDR